MAPYLEGLAEDVSTQHDGGQVKVMQSSGGMLSAAAAAREPVRTVLSGPPAESSALAASHAGPA